MNRIKTMHTTSLILSSLLLALSLATTAHATTRVFLLGGQSNMVGTGKKSELKTPYDADQPDVKFWGNNGWLPLGPACDGRAEAFGPEISFGRAIKDALPGDEIYLVKYAVSGTALYNDWSPQSGGKQYQKFMQTAKAALANLEAAGIKYEISGMLWMQGESDAEENKGDEYDKNIRAFIAHMREQFKTPDMPFVMARVRNHYGGKSGQAALVRTAQQKVAEATDGVDWFDTDDYSMMNAGHYSGPGLINMGKDFAKAITKLLGS